MTPTIKQIQARAAEICGVRLEDILSERRQEDVTRARHIAMYASRLMTPHSLPTIGKAFHRDHTTVLIAVRQLDVKVNRDEQLRQTIRDICCGWHDRYQIGPVVRDWRKGA